MRKLSIDTATKVISINHANGQPLACPFTPPIIAPPDNFGRTQIVRMQCNDLCPHFHCVDGSVKISCSGEMVSVIEGNLSSL